MKKLSLFLSILLLSIGAFAQQATWKTDPAHSSVNFKIKHMGISFIPGKFDKFSGTMTASKADFTDAKITFTADVNSINTSVEQRDNHLKTSDFFDAAQYPQMKFESTSFKKAGNNNTNKKMADNFDGDLYELTGNLTIKDVTKPVTFKVTYNGQATDQQGNVKAGFLAKNTINRFDYHINYDPSGQGVAKEVEIMIYLEMVRQ